MFFKNKTSNKERGGRSWYMLVFSLLLAFIMWCGQKFSNDYSWYLKYRLEITTNISGRANSAVSNELLILNAKLKGFEILKNSYSKDKQILRIEGVDKKFLTKKNNSDLFYISPIDLKQKIQEAIGSEIQLETIVTDTLSFILPEQAYKRVPIVPKTDISYKSQYMPVTDIKLVPDSVNVYGNLLETDRIASVSTELIKGANIMQSLSGVVKLNSIEGVSFSISEVIYSQEVERFVESKVIIPIEIENAPDDVNIIVYPAEVAVYYRQLYSLIINRNSADFTIAVDYADILKNRIVQPFLMRKPNDVISYRIEPKFVECVL